MSEYDENEDRVSHAEIRMRDVMRFAAHYMARRPFVIATYIGAFVLATLADTLMTVAGGRIIDAVTGHAGQGEDMFAAAMWALGMFAGLAILRNLLRNYGGWMSIVLNTACMREIVDDAFARVQRFATDWHANTFAGSTVRKISRGMWAFDTMADTIFMGLLPAFTVVVGSVVLLTAFHWQIGLFAVVSIALYMTVSILLAVRWQAPANRDAAAQDSRLGGGLADAVTCNPVVKAFGAEAREDERLRGMTTRWFNLTRRSWFRSVWTEFWQAWLSLLNSCGMLALALWFAAQGEATPGEVTFALTMSFLINGYLRDIGSHVRNLQRSVNDMEDVVAMSLLDPGVADRPGARPLAISHERGVAGEIRFEDVSFTYAGQNDPVYRDFGITIRPGEKVGLVGHSGSGKSTFVKLVQRLYDLDRGRILIDGQDIAAVTQRSLRQAVSIVAQDPVLFHRSLAENIAYGRSDATMDEIMDAARKARAHDFIMSLPKGYDTLVGERGVKLSGGERQRVAIARAILADAPVLILDEATSSLDSVSEALIQEALETLMEGRTTIIVAHRLSTIQSVDRILVFDAGRVVEEGSHADLVAKRDGHYRRLFDMQVMGLSQGARASDVLMRPDAAE